MAGKRVRLASLAESKVEATPGAGRPDLIHVPPQSVAPTPLNPRRNFDADELAELGEDMRAGQLQPCVAVPRPAYLKLYPEHAEQLPDECRYVMAAGERRWRAAAMVGLDTLDVMLRHDLTESRVRFLGAVLSENLQRANFNPIEEANGVQAMLDLHDGNQAAAARSIGKSKGWVNQRVGLLRLTDEMVQLVLDGKLSAFREMRRYAAMPAQEQYTAWKLDQEQPRQQPTPSPAAPPALPKTASAEPEAYTAVHTPAADPEPVAAQEAASGAGSFTAVKPEPSAARPPAPALPVQSSVLEQALPPVPDGAAGRPESIPEPREAAVQPESEERPQGRLFPYHDGLSAAQYLIHRMPMEEFDRMLDRLIEHRGRATAEAS